jgi:DNA-binding SARP family transcriptional activator
MEFRILGPLEVHDGAAPVAIPGVKERALLADLLVHTGRVVPADRLVEDLWGDDPPANPGERAFRAATTAGRDRPADQALRVALHGNR